MTREVWRAGRQVVDAHVHAWPPAATTDISNQPTWSVAREALELGTLVARVVLVTPGQPPGDDAWTVSVAAASEGKVAAVVRANSLDLVESGRRPRSGVRIVLPAHPSADIDSAVENAAARGAPVCVQNLSGDWSYLRSWARRLPDTTFLVDHLGHPDLDAGPDGRSWAAFRALADHANVVTKLPNLVSFTGGLEHVWRLSEFIAAVLKSYGPERVLWASDWPNTGAVAYRRLLGTALRLVADLDEGAVGSVFWDNAARLIWSDDAGAPRGTELTGRTSIQYGERPP